MAWINSSGMAGIEFLDSSPRASRLLKDWLFTQLLSDANRLSGNPAAELLFSSTPRPAIRLANAQLAKPIKKPLRLLWLPVSAHGFARLVDGLALLCAVLLFSVLALTLTGALPSWPIAAVLLLGAGGIFALLYGFLFSLWFGTTPGRRLAELAGRVSVRPARKEDPDSVPLEGVSASDIAEPARVANPGSSAGSFQQSGFRYCPAYSTPPLPEL